MQNEYRRSVGLRFHIDSNLINASGRLDAMNQLEEWYENGVIDINFSEPATRETYDSNYMSGKRKAKKYMHHATFADTESEKKDIEEIKNIVFPNGATKQSEETDILLIFTAKKYGAILITNDGDSNKQKRGILGAATDLKERFNLDIMRHKEAVELVKRTIKQRDNNAKNRYQKRGVPLPDWYELD